MQPEPQSADPLNMPDLYFERTTPEEQARHREKLARLVPGELLIEPVVDAEGGWHVEIVTTDWEEPGLLDRIFEAVLRCIHIPGGIAQRRTRIFTGMHGQVVNILELQNRRGEPLTEEACTQVLERLRDIRPGERSGLDNIEHLPFVSLIPHLPDFPLIDNERSARYTYVELQSERLSNRFASILLNFLARSDLWLNIQVAEFVQQEQGRYCFWVVDKYGRKLEDSHLNRRSVVVALQGMNLMLLRFNARYIERDWLYRIETNQHTIYHSRPNPRDFLEDLQNIRELAILKGFENRLSALVEGGLLEKADFFFLKKVQTFVEQHADAFLAAQDVPPAEEQIELAREYFTYRRHALRIMSPLFNKLLKLDPISVDMTDKQRLRAMCHPADPGKYAMDSGFQIYPEGSIWMHEPAMSLEPLYLLAHTGGHLAEETQESIEGVLEEWTPAYQASNKAALGRKFLATLDDSIRQSNTAIVMRNMRNLGLLQRYVPDFAAIQGLIHVIADHRYTVDEHSFVGMEVLGGLKLMHDLLPRPGKSPMRTDYERIRDHVALRNYARKYAVEMRMVGRVTELRSNPAVRPFLQLMQQAQTNPLDFLVDMNFLEHGYTLCMGGLSEIETVRRQLDSIIRTYNALPFRARRILMLTALFHDLKKPAKEHPQLMAEALPASLDTMGIELPAEDVADLQFLVGEHLAVRKLMDRMGNDGPQAVLDYAAQAGSRERVRMLILFTYADRVAVYLDRNKNAHDAMTLAEMLNVLGPD